MAIGEAFFLGLLTPIGAACVLPLYPGFLAFLANKLGEDSSRKNQILISLVISLGVILFMLLLGLLFTTILQVSLTNVINIVSRIAFIILIIISLFLIFNIDVGKYLPKANIPQLESPTKSAFIFGFFFGAIVIPCNPLFIAAFFTRAVTTLGFFANMVDFFFFGIGLASPLVVLALISASSGNRIINFLTKYKRWINLVVGVIMLVISIYYLVCTFGGVQCPMLFY